MAAQPVFIDTTALLALVNADDALHPRCVQAYRELDSERVPLVTSEWILAEFLNGTSRAPLRAAGLAVLNALRASDRTSIVPATHDWWERGLSLYAARADKDWSLVDCISIALCEESRITRVLTGDRHFAQAGLDALLL